jgi:hypothetical protein
MILGLLSWFVNPAFFTISISWQVKLKKVNGSVGGLGPRNGNVAAPWITRVIKPGLPLVDAVPGPA